MVVNRDKSPTAQETFLQMAQAAGLRGRILVTIGILILVRLGMFLPLPDINRAAFAESIQNSPLINFLNIFSGIATLGIFALGILPFINASIILQLLTSALPALENLQKNEGEAGRRKIAQITRYVSLGWAVAQSVGIAFWVRPFVANWGPAFVFQTVVALTAGSMFIMWLGELITERGIGNGASLLIFVNIVSSLPEALGKTLDLAQVDRSAVGGVVILLAMFLVMIAGIVFVQEGIRRIPILSARRQVGRRMMMERSSYLPLRLNQGGVMPIIFASTVLSLPGFLVQAVPNQFTNGIAEWMRPDRPFHVLFYFLLILFFSYFYSSLVMNPVDVSQNLKKMGASIPGVRPGKATSDYISKVINRLTFLGAMFLGFVAIVPTAVESATRVKTFQGVGATSLLILVGVAIETAKQVQTYVISQRYEGMVKQ
jgi:preprotein translocase subunit SecY